MLSTLSQNQPELLLVPIQLLNLNDIYSQDQQTPSFFDLSSLQSTNAAPQLNNKIQARLAKQRAQLKAQSQQTDGQIFAQLSQQNPQVPTTTTSSQNFIQAPPQAFAASNPLSANDQRELLLAKSLNPADPQRCELERKEDLLLGCQTPKQLLDCKPEREPREAFQGPAYIALSAADKLAKLRKSINACAGISGKFVDDPIKALLAEQVQPAFETHGDTLPIGRVKIVHAVGAVGEIAFESNGQHPFSGLFKSGCDSGLVRFSSGLGFQLNNPLRPIDPTAAIKCLRNGAESGNLLVGAGFDGQPQSFSFLFQSFTNRPLPTTSRADMLCVQNKFHQVSEWPTNLGSADFASIDINGKPVDKISNPVKLTLKPAVSLPNQEPGAQPCNLESKVLDSLGTIPVGSTIWNVFGNQNIISVTELTLTPEIPIGKIVLKSPIIKSRFGDEDLYFRHQTLGNDDDRANPDPTKSLRDFFPVILTSDSCACPGFAPKDRTDVPGNLSNLDKLT